MLFYTLFVAPLCFQFEASGLMVIARNFLDVYPYEKWDTKVSGSIRVNLVITSQCVI